MERSYSKKRPEVNEMPWGTIDLSGVRAEVVLAARRAWTSAAFQEHRTGAACAITLRALIEARAPLDLIALASRFPLDEIVHVELCARLAMEMGGGTEILHDPSHLTHQADPSLPPVLRAADLIIRFFCVGEALSIPLLHGTWQAASHPLPRAILGRIVRDEAAHGTFGWTFLDWALPELDRSALAHLSNAAAVTIESVKQTWEDIRSRPVATADEAHALGWMESSAYLELAERSLVEHVLVPLRDRGLA
jgi:hypothetical protein